MSSIADHAIETVAAGRTDAGVHAYNQVVHFDSGAPRTDQAWILGANTQLPPSIALRWAVRVDEAFHARRSAVARRYRYVILNARARPALFDGRVAWQTRPLDEGAMHRAAQVLVGEHDFSAFRDSDCQSKTPMRNVHAISVRRLGEFVALEVKANAFLHHMVRNIAGVLIAIGEARQPETWARVVLEGRKRERGGVTAEPGGLYFIGPEYPASFKLPAAPAPWFPGWLP